VSRTSKTILILISFSPLIVLLCVPFLDRTTEPEAVPGQANVVFNQPGKFASPNGELFVNVWARADGQLLHSWEHPSGSPSSTFLTPISPQSNWFMCWDDQNRLWVYLPSNPNYCCTYYHTEKGSGVRECGELGGWDGVPQAFLDRLPEMALKTYRQAQEHQKAKTSVSGP